MSPIAMAQIIQHFADGSITEMTVALDVDSPDAADECVNRVRALWRECVAVEDAES